MKSSTNKTIRISEVFYHRLVNRDGGQGDGKYTAIEFRGKFLAELEDSEWWANKSKSIVLDFDGVKVLSPSWANEIFAYYAQNYSSDQIQAKIELINISDVKRAIVKNEIDSGRSQP